MQKTAGKRFEKLEKEFTQPFSNYYWNGNKQVRFRYYDDSFYELLKESEDDYRMIVEGNSFNHEIVLTFLDNEEWLWHIKDEANIENEIQTYQKIKI